MPKSGHSVPPVLMVPNCLTMRGDNCKQTTTTVKLEHTVMDRDKEMGNANFWPFYTELEFKIKGTLKVKFITFL